MIALCQGSRLIFYPSSEGHFFLFLAAAAESVIALLNRNFRLVFRLQRMLSTLPEATR